MTPANIPNLRNRDILWQLHTSATAFLIMLRVSAEVNKPLPQLATV